MSSVAEDPDPLFPSGTGFPLGRLVLPVQGTASETCSGVREPLGLRYAVAPTQVEAILDLDVIGYDEQS